MNVDCGCVLSGSVCEFVELQTLSRKREAFSAQSQEDMNFDGAWVKHRRHPEESSCRPRHGRTRSRPSRVHGGEGRTKSTAFAEWNMEANIGGTRQSG